MHCVSRRVIYKDLIASIEVVRWIVHRRRIEVAVLIVPTKVVLRCRQSTPPNDTKVWTMRGPAATQAMTGERCNRQLSLSPYGGQSTFISKSTDKTPQIFVFKRKRHERHYSWTFLQHYFCMLLKKSRKKNSSHDIVLDVHVIITILLCKYLLIFID